MKKLTRTEIARELHARHGGLSLEQMGGVLETLLDLLGEAIQRDGCLSLPGFGSFHRVQRSGRLVATPSGKRAPVAATRVRFIPSTQLKQRLQQAGGHEPDPS
jgi:nucleoid DNA-binding protein